MEEFVRTILPQKISFIVPFKDKKGNIIQNGIEMILKKYVKTQTYIAEDNSSIVKDEPYNPKRKSSEDNEQKYK